VIVFDLSFIKGGAAGILYSFDALVRSRLVDDLEIHAILCLAENATGPNSYRNGDIIRMHSKKTVEIWNTDAEGRILLGDAVSYAADQLKASLIIDMATLTGAQGISTGQKHAAIYSNSEELEKLATIAGRYSGDLTHPLPYIPEFLRSDISSPIADLRNAAASQNNAYSACAAQFIGEHLPHSFSGKWLHIDMARPSKRGDLSSAYGPALLLSLIPAIYSMR
jgi:probable aminopeptidase NPEPL1